jgi:transglutaminase-like putative cysteine protease
LTKTTKTTEPDGIAFKPAAEPSGGADFAPRAALGLASFAAALGCVWRGLNLGGGGYNPAGLIAVGAVFCVLNCGLRGKMKTAPAVAALALAVYAAAAHRLILDGWNITMNQIFAGLEARLGRIFPRYNAAESAPELRATLFMLIPAGILGLAAGYSARGKLVFHLIFGGITAAAALAGVYSPDGWTVLFILAAAAVCAFGAARRNNFGASPRAVYCTLAAVAALTAASLVPALVTGDLSASAETRRIAAERKIYSLRYEEEKQILPRGDFRKLGGFTPDESKTVLSVEMSAPAELYLRGFVGERYTGDGWTALSASRRAESAKEFSWLHDRGFFAQNQIAELSEALRINEETNTVSVQNLTAGAGCVYAPYELADGAPDAAQIGDADLPAAGLRGQRKYVYETTGVSVAGCDALYDALAEAWRAGGGGVTEYLKSENVFREYVYANYLDLPEAAAEAVREMLGGELPSGAVGFEAARQIVQDRVSYSLGYSETPAKYAGGDFMTYLTESGEGYDPHFATAAVLMFRSLGIPARYVEGWYISEAEANAAAANGIPVAVTEGAAHAWAEIYRDGVGFVPFEVIPSASSSASSSAAQENVNFTDDEEDPSAAPDLLKILLIVLIAAVVLLALCFAALAVRRRIRVKRWERMLARGAPGAAAEQLTAYIVRLLHRMGIERGNESLFAMKDAVSEMLGGETAELFAEAVAIQQEARFSAKPPDAARSAGVRGLADTVARSLRGRSKLPVRFRLKYIECLI